MVYVEYLRVRRALVVYTIVAALLSALVTTSLHFGHVETSGNFTKHDLQHIVIPLSAVLLATGFGALIFGTLLAGSLNRERETLSLSWTRPIARERFGLTYVLVDLCGILVSWIVVLALTAIPFITTGFASKLIFDADVASAIAIILGVTVMWYGLVQAATSWYRGRAGLAIGLSWLVFIALIPMHNVMWLGPLFHDIVVGLNYLNPLAYLDSYTPQPGNDTQIRATSQLPLSSLVRIAASWLVGIAACAVAIFAWKRSEV